MRTKVDGAPVHPAGADEVGEHIGEHRRLGRKLIVSAIEASERVRDRSLCFLYPSARGIIYPGETEALGHPGLTSAAPCGS
jgi:hypothetical protein